MLSGMRKWWRRRRGLEGRFWDMLGRRYPGVTKGLKIELLQVRHKEAIVGVRVIDLDHPLTVLWDMGVMSLRFESGAAWHVVNLDAETCVAPDEKQP